MTTSEPCSIVLMTSSAPFSMSEIWFQAEVEYLATKGSVFMLPVWPRGARNQWPGGQIIGNGRPQRNVVKTMTTILQTKALRRLLWSSRDAANVRTGAKMVIATITGVQWALQCQSEGRNVRHVHASTVGAPSAAAAAFVVVTGCSGSSTAHRNDINRRAPRAALGHLKVIRAISLRAQEMLASHSIESDVLRFGAIHQVEPFNRGEATASLRCVSIGHLVPSKGHLRSLEMFAVLKANNVDATLDIVGAGPDQEELVERIRVLRLSDNVRLLGRREHHDLLSAMRSGKWNVLVHSSVQLGDDHEGIPVAILEAAACNIAVVATASGSTSEFVNDGVNGILIEPTVDDLAVTQGVNALTLLAQESELRFRLAEQANHDAQAFVAAVTVEVLADRVLLAERLTR